MAIKLPPVPQEPIAETFRWREFFIKLQQIMSGVGSVSWSLIDFTGSNLTDIVTRRHNDLQAIQGGNSTERYHLSNVELQRMKSNQVLTWLSM